MYIKKKKMKGLLIVLLLISFVVNKEIKCQPNEALDEQTQKCEKKCEEGKVFDSDTLSVNYIQLI